MPQINGPIFDSAGRPASGWIRVRATRAYEHGGGLATTALSTARVVEGVPAVDGLPWTLPATPAGVWLEIEQDLDGEAQSRFHVRVPALAALTYGELLYYRGDGVGGTEPYFWDLSGGADFPPEAPIGDWGIDYTSDPTKVLIFKKGA